MLPFLPLLSLLLLLLLLCSLSLLPLLYSLSLLSLLPFKRLTETAAEIYQIEHITVLIKENPPENVGVGGELTLDRKQRETGEPQSQG